ncbi:hypothetical protein V6N12_054360 [Hibiscus sabdariffa]|uniref:Secreted protein n=1 Tax=Hibiscus sabdariffa TaxID=183260 RepID=A0ABR2D075_9ROSI
MTIQVWWRLYWLIEGILSEILLSDLLLFESQTEYQNSYFGRGIKRRIHRVRLIDLLFMPSNSSGKWLGDL